MQAGPAGRPDEMLGADERWCCCSSSEGAARCTSRWDGYEAIVGSLVASRSAPGNWTGSRRNSAN